MRRALLAAVAGLVLAAPSAQAAQLDVTTTADAPGICLDGACPTLRAALATAAGTAETDTIRLPAGDYALLSDLTVPAGVTITGASARTTAVHGAVLSVAGDATIAHATIGALSNDGTLKLDRVHASGIVNHASLTLTLGLVDGAVTSDGTLTASDSTIASDVSATAGKLTRVTVSGSASFGAGMHVGGSVLTACGPLGPVSDGGNLVPFACPWAGVGDRLSANPKLGAAPVNAGGETDVLRLGLGSDAIGQAGACTGTDQRELARPQGALCDAGAYEVEVVQLTGPDGPTRSNVATFTFTAAPGSTFRCKLDGDEDACASPFASPALADGAHTFTVQAFDGDTAVSEPVTRTFTVDTVEPTIQLTGPPPLGRLDHVSFAFTASEDVTFACKLDGDGFAGCGSPKEYVDLDDGSHTFTVRATDAAGNVGEETRTFAIDTIAPPAPHIDAPANGALLTSTPITFHGTALEPGFVSIFEGSTLKGRVQVAGDGTWQLDVPATDGAHSYTAKLEDAAGNFSDPDTVTVTVDANAPAAPQIDSPTEGAAQRSTTVTLSGRTEPGAVIAVFEGPDARGTATADAGGAWTVAVANVAEGVHEYTATATDAAGHTSAASARHVRVDLTPPPAPQVSGDTSGFTLVSPEPGAALSCSVDGGGFLPCASGVTFPGLAPGDHVLAVRATDAAGNESPATSWRFSVAAPAVVASTPTPTPVATPAYRKTVVLRPQAGHTLIKRSGDAAFTEIRVRTAVPVGTAVNVKQGAVIVIAATATGTETAKFAGGIFTASGTDLTLSETLRCGRTRRLTGDGAGAFRIRGRYASATGRGARWTVEDTCKQTRISVTRGVVAVLDNRRSKTILIRSGRSYTARPKR